MINYYTQMLIHTETRHTETISLCRGETENYWREAPSTAIVQYKPKERGGNNPTGEIILKQGSSPPIGVLNSYRTGMDWNSCWSYDPLNECCLTKQMDKLLILWMNEVWCLKSTRKYFLKNQTTQLMKSSHSWALFGSTIMKKQSEIFGSQIIDAFKSLISHQLVSTQNMYILSSVIVKKEAHKTK